FASAACLTLLLFTPADDPKDTAKKRYAEVQATWNVTSQEWSRRVMVSSEYLVKYYSFAFQGDTCVIRASVPDIENQRVLDIETKWKVELQERKEFLEIHLAHPNGQVEFRALIRKHKEDGIQIAITWNDGKSPNGFNPTKDSVVLLTC